MLKRSIATIQSEQDNEARVESDRKTTVDPLI